MSNSQNRARARAHATRPETALVGWTAAAHAGVPSRRGPQTDHLAVLVRRARRRAAMRRALRLWFPRRKASLPGVPTEVSVRAAVQTGLSAALPRPAASEHYAYAIARSRRMHPAERRHGLIDRRSLDEAHAGPERRGTHHPAGRRHVDLPQQRSRPAALAHQD